MSWRLVCSTDVGPRSPECCRLDLLHATDSDVRHECWERPHRGATCRQAWAFGAGADSHTVDQAFDTTSEYVSCVDSRLWREAHDLMGSLVAMVGWLTAQRSRARTTSQRSPRCS